MLQNWISQNMFLYGMAAAGVLGLLCTLAANHFYNRVIGDLKRPDQPKTKWMGQTLSLYRKKSRGKMLPNPDVFVRNQLNEGRVLGISLSRWRRGVGYLGLVCFAGTCAAVYGCYQYHLPEIVRYQHAVLGMGIFLGLAMLSQSFGFAGKERQIRDGLLDYMENRVSAVQSQQEPAQAEEKEKGILIDQVMQGVKQTAAAGTKFSGLLSREEEQVMREVIREYLT